MEVPKGQESPATMLPEQARTSHTVSEVDAIPTELPIEKTFLAEEITPPQEVVARRTEISSKFKKAAWIAACTLGVALVGGLLVGLSFIPGGLPLAATILFGVGVVLLVGGGGVSASFGIGAAIRGEQRHRLGPDTEKRLVNEYNTRTNTLQELLSKQGPLLTNCRTQTGLQALRLEERKMLESILKALHAQYQSYCELPDHRKESSPWARFQEITPDSFKALTEERLSNPKNGTKFLLALLKWVSAPEDQRTAPGEELKTEFADIHERYRRELRETGF